MAKKTKDSRCLSLSDFYCTQCGMKGIPVFRTIGQEREPGHLKKLYCIHCQKETNQAEIRPRGRYTLDDFWVEYEGGNFTPTGDRIESWKTFVANYYKKEITD